MSISKRTILTSSNPVKNDNATKNPVHTRRLVLRENLDCDIVYHYVVTKLFVCVFGRVAVEVVRCARDIWVTQRDKRHEYLLRLLRIPIHCVYPICERSVVTLRRTRQRHQRGIRELRDHVACEVTEVFGVFV